MIDATVRPLRAVIAEIQAALAAGVTLIEVVALDPERGVGLYAGEFVEVDGVACVHRSLQTWIDLASRLGLRLAVPGAVDVARVLLRFAKLPAVADEGARGTEKYGAGSEHARRDKLEDPNFVIDMNEALARMALPVGPRVLVLGCNRGDELPLVYARWPAAQILGVDHSASALAVARPRFAAARFVELDLAQLAAHPDLGRFELVIAIDTLHSPGIADGPLLRHLVLERLAPTGCLLLGFPNARYRGGELEYGARVVNLTEPELGTLVKDVGFYRRYLAQHRLRVFVTGKYEVLVTAIPISGNGSLRSRGPE